MLGRGPPTPTTREWPAAARGVAGRGGAACRHRARPLDPRATRARIRGDSAARGESVAELLRLGPPHKGRVCRGPSTPDAGE